MKFNLTNSAAERINELILSKPDVNMLRISVDGGGCSGFMYNFELVKDKDQDDQTIQHQGATVVIDSMSAEFLDNCTLDFIKELGSSFFQINNPGAGAKCGCGNSFSV